MGFWSNLLMAILSVINPIIGFIASTVKYVISEAKNAGFVYLIDVISNILPGGFIKDLAAGMISDAVEVFSLKSAVDEVIPFNNIILTCERCGSNSHYFVKKDGLITCKDCFRNNVESEIERPNKIYLIKNNIRTIKHEFLTLNKESVTSKFISLPNPKKFPTLSNKFKKFNK